MTSEFLIHSMIWHFRIWEELDKHGLACPHKVWWVWN